MTVRLSGIIGWVTGALAALGGQPRSWPWAPIHVRRWSASALGAVFLAAAVAGVTAWRTNHHLPEAGTWRAAIGSMVAGAAAGALTFLVLGAVAYVAAVVFFVHSGFAW
jgi:hypothetical protein